MLRPMMEWDFEKMGDLGRDGKTLEERPLSTEKGVSLPNPLSTKAVPTALRPR